MTPERWLQVEQIYNDALERDPDEREAFVYQACSGDEELRIEVESLLASHEQAGSFMVSLSEDLAAGMVTEEHASLMVGRMLGRYKLLALLGMGGMGEVYRARDLRLGREVAIKILPEHLAEDKEALRRFEREAKAVAALSHPNILAIYDFDTEQGLSFAVTELLEGENMRVRLSRSRLSWRRAAEIGAAVAEGLAAAHAKKIIHRDIKPENIFLTDDDKVKILDFGIARMRRPASDNEAAPTLNSGSSDISLPGTVRGTMGYMSPEQLRGEPIEKPSDIFSLGCVLYEAVSGRRAFARPTTIETMAAVLNEEPPPLAETVKEIPEELEHLIFRCLKKKPDERFQSARDLASALNAILGKDAAVTVPTLAQPWRPLMGVGAAVVIALLGVAAWHYLFGQQEPTPRSTINTVAAAKRMTIIPLTNTGNISCAAISPDGKYVVYAILDKPNQSSLWIHQIDTSNRRPIIPSSEARYWDLTFSRDGNYLYYTATTSEKPAQTLHRVSLLGGQVRKVLERVDSSISFSPDGSKFVFKRRLPERRESALIIATADGGDEKEIAAIRYPEHFNDPAWSPDGKMIACGAGVAEGTANMYVVGVSTEDWSVKQISTGRWEWVGQMDWLRDSSGLMMIAQSLPGEAYQVWQLSYPKGEARKITNEVIHWNRLSLAADANAMAGLQVHLLTNVWLIPAENGPNARQITFGTGGYRSGISWTPDGKIVVDTFTGNSRTISSMDADGNNPRQLTGEIFENEHVGAATVTGDGRYIVFVSDFKGERHIWRMNIDGSNPIQLTDGTGEDLPHCSPDGRWVVYVRMERPGVPGPTLWKVSIDGGEPSQLTDSISTFPAISPDGKLIACMLAEEPRGTRWQMAVLPFSGGSPVKVFPQKHQARVVRWTPDGRGLTYADNPAIGVSKIWVQPLDGGEPKLLVQSETDRFFGFDWSPDGKYLACVRGLWSTNVSVIQNLK